MLNFTDLSETSLLALFKEMPLGKLIADLESEALDSLILPYLHDFVYMTHACALAKEHEVGSTLFSIIGEGLKKLLINNSKPRQCNI